MIVPKANVDVAEIEGQLSLFDVNEKNECLGEPCKYCDIEWCSIECFRRRGYVYDRVHRFARNSNGEYLRREIEYRVCKKE